MKILAIAVFAALSAFAGGKDEPHHKPVIAPNPAWERLKTLEGTWVGKNKETFTYKVVSGGSAVLETIGMGDEGMVTMYSPDGGSVLMTHYCAMGNQPRMRAKGKDADKIVFSYIDATNLKGNDDHVMNGLAITFKDADHIVEVWASKAKKGASESSTFELARQK